MLTFWFSFCILQIEIRTVQYMRLEVGTSATSRQVAAAMISELLVWGHNAEPLRVAIHSQDSDCTVDGDSGYCSGCGVWHEHPCIGCGQTAFHTTGCEEMAAYGEVR